MFSLLYIRFDAVKRSKKRDKWNKNEVIKRHSSFSCRGPNMMSKHCPALKSDASVSAAAMADVIHAAQGSGRFRSKVPAGHAAAAQDPILAARTIGASVS